MKYIQLTKGKQVIIDDEDFEWLSQWSWHCHATGYAIRTDYPNGPQGGTKTVWMHRVINQTPDNLYTDHVNENRLDNRKDNLRTATMAQNRINCGPPANNTSGYRGVMWHKRDKIWVAYLYKNGKRIQLGSTNSLKEAVRLRAEAEQRLFGEFAHSTVSKGWDGGVFG